MIIYTLADKDKWIDEFESLRIKISTEDNHRKSKNYDYNLLKLEEQEEASIAYHNNKIVAFSFMCTRPFWGNISRVFNRFYVIPEYRNNVFGKNQKSIGATTLAESSKKPFGRMMLDVQIDAAKRMNKDLIFMSREYPSIRWIDNWKEARPTWETNRDHLFQVCLADHVSCWQHCIWLNLNSSNNFSLPSCSINTWKLKYHNKVQEDSNV